MVRVEAEVGTDCLGRSKPRRIIDRVAIGECGHDADAGNSHEAADHFIGSRDILKLPVNLGLFRKNMLVDRQKVFDDA